MTISRSFDYVAAPDAGILILGSMPGVESLRQQQYYAHPRNAFWDIMGGLFGFGRTLPYPERLQKLKQSRIALWDVAHQCERPGSLDGNIRTGSVIANDFQSFFALHSGIKAIFFNGRKAAELYRRLVLPDLPEPWQSLPLHPLPSTSPAHAAMDYKAKLQAWLQIKAFTATVVG